MQRKFVRDRVLDEYRSRSGVSSIALQLESPLRSYERSLVNHLHLEQNRNCEESVSEHRHISYEMSRSPDSECQQFVPRGV